LCNSSIMPKQNKNWNTVWHFNIYLTFLLVIITAWIPHRPYWVHRVYFVNVLAKLNSIPKWCCKHRIKKYFPSKHFIILEVIHCAAAKGKYKDFLFTLYQPQKPFTIASDSLKKKEACVINMWRDTNAAFIYRGH
jgi:hypothetical protein